ncbi:FAD-binding oxidoreductase [uncultured Aquimarina sp.]|uniref:FAD-dependent oxidoreductase n=1 Tax=uncultured Aquimarina sp. TaxID=575652 RepID=UPI0026017344|nr:FAD-binding oxidoreductase [uncultured Aquimarina sp.]
MINCKELRNKFKEQGCTFTIVCPTDPNYAKSRIIANSRFNYYPLAIGYCENAKDVSSTIKICKEAGLHLRIRSGGHQHEGMCSDNDVFIIDLSKIHTIRYTDKTNDYAWIPPGKKLREVYKELESKNRIIPGGGCGSVNVGGLTQGGGWGLSARKFGLTADNIIEAEIVLANGKIVKANKDNHSELFWAIRGGGGGNFGVITNFLFKLSPLRGNITTFELHWPKDKMLKIAKKWMQELPTHTYNLTTACRLSVTDQNTPSRTAVLLVGQFYGEISDLQKILKPFYDISKPTYELYESQTYIEIVNALLHSKKQSEPLPSLLAKRQTRLGSLLQPIASVVKDEEAPTQTCDGPHPHKISSAFPIYDDALVDKIVTYLDDTKASEVVNLYLSLHGMGGAIQDFTEGPFPYRAKDFLLQFQAWWSDPKDSNTEKYIKWIEDFRTALQPHVEGAFINFPDASLVNQSDTTKGRIELLQYYYGDNLPKLIEIKKQVDPENLFSFGMSIPTEI